MSARTVVYDTGMLLAMLSGERVALALHHGLRAAPHRPVVIGPVLAQAWRPDPKTVHAFSGYLRDCTVPQARGAAPPVQGRTAANAGCVACSKTTTLDSYKRAGAMLARAAPPGKKRPDAVDALVVVTAALHVPALIVTSDPGDLAAYAATLDNADLVIERV
ncbi:hypothetical protein ACFHW2_12940 [Actinomadura sp. LOL_016]|uniref:hypothetical protein n=1 Tax=unclassified Actinomadura TaxID=2626254 RepID=UPI003A8061F6